MTTATYDVAHWSTALAESNYRSQAVQTVTVNDRAATRQAIISEIRNEKIEFSERSDWFAQKNKSSEMIDDWNYTKIAIHHAGRSYRCGPGTSQLLKIQNLHMANNKWPDIGYHYAIDCSGKIYEGRDIRFKGSHLHEYNTGVIGIVFLENLSTPEDSFGDLGLLFSALKKIAGTVDVVIPSIQKNNAAKFISILRQFFRIQNLGGHQEFPKQNSSEARLCPGTHGMRLVKELRTLSKLSPP